ncbi:winged helix-turn-helix domain-containing protein [Candidatus Poribacteria bacterium]|nr:winged helix-turn-helix domain-containing protein [Candidatus Poribacteria bacterium]
METPGKGQRQRADLSLEEERHFLEPFNEPSAKGQVPTVREIHLALEERLARLVAKSTVYRLLKRHPFRKVAPRPHHPQADPRGKRPEGTPIIATDTGTPHRHPEISFSVLQEFKAVVVGQTICCGQSGERRPVLFAHAGPRHGKPHVP